MHWMESNLLDCSWPTISLVYSTSSEGLVRNLVLALERVLEFIHCFWLRLWRWDGRQELGGLSAKVIHFRNKLWSDEFCKHLQWWHTRHRLCLCFELFGPAQCLPFQIDNKPMSWPLLCKCTHSYDSFLKIYCWNSSTFDFFRWGSASAITLSQSSPNNDCIYRVIGPNHLMWSIWQPVF